VVRSRLSREGVSGRGHLLRVLGVLVVRRLDVGRVVSRRRWGRRAVRRVDGLAQSGSILRVRLLMLLGRVRLLVLVRLVVYRRREREVRDGRLPWLLTLCHPRRLLVGRVVLIEITGRSLRARTDTDGR
jgi:hypothetical protein